MEWYINQDIVAVKEPDNKMFKIGDPLIITGLRESDCKCSKVSICVGHIYSTDFFMWCSKCGIRKTYPAGPIYWSEKMFRPLDELVNIDELMEILSEPVFK